MPWLISLCLIDRSKLKWCAMMKILTLFSIIHLMHFPYVTNNHSRIYKCEKWSFFLPNFSYCIYCVSCGMTFIWYAASRTIAINISSKSLWRNCVKEEKWKCYLKCQIRMTKIKSKRAKILSLGTQWAHAAYTVNIFLVKASHWQTKYTYADCWITD